jgi:hypothetical protein
MRTAVLSGFQPQVRSASPIAQDDQRLGMPGFEEAPLAAAPLTDDEPESSMIADSPPGSSLAAPARALRRQGVLSPAAASAIMTPQPRGSADNFESRPQFPRATQAPTPGTSEEAAGLEIAEIHPALPRTAAAAGSFDVQTAGSPRIEIAPSGATASESPAAHAWESVEEAETPLLEPAPPQTAAASARTSARNQDDAPEPVEDREPRIVIGSINVEVIPATPEPAKTEPTRPKPLTAAAASVIGPLSKGVRSGRLLSLRYR